MNRTISAFGDFPWYFQNQEWLARLSHQMDTLNILSASSCLQTAAALASFPILQEVNRLTALYSTSTSQTIREITNMVNKLNISPTPLPRGWDIPSLHFDYSPNVPKYIAEWSNPLYNIWNETPVVKETLLADRDRKLTHLTSLAEEVRCSKTFQEAPAPSENDYQAAAEEVNAIFASGQNWEQRFMDSIKRFQKTHPVVAWLLKNVLFVIVLELIISLSNSCIGEMLHHARLYKEPSVSSQVIYQIKSYQSIIVIGDVPYYYAAQIKDPQTDEIISGYVSKRSVQLCESESPKESKPELKVPAPKAEPNDVPAGQS